MSNLKIEGKVGDFCPNCKNCKAVTRMHDGETASIRLTEVECEDPYDAMVKTLNVDSDICCSLFEPKPACEKCERFDGTYCHSPEGIFVTSYMATGNCSFYSEKKEKEPCDEISCLQHELEMDKLRSKIHELEKEKADHLKGIERLKKSQEKLQNQVKNLQTTNEESYKREEKLEDKVHKLERRLLEENKRFSRLDTEFLMPLARVLYPREAKICKPYSEILEDIKLLNKGVYDLEEDCKRLADKNKALFEENLDRLDKHTKQCQEIDDLKNELKNANKLADSWKRDYEFVRDQLIHPIYDILYPDNPNRDINVTDFINDVKDLKVYADENGRMYKEIQEWREKCIARGIDVDRLLSEIKEKDKKISELESSRDAWSNTATARAEQVIEVTKDRDKWRSLYNSLSETCADYDKRCKEECEKKYRDEISKLQNIVTEKDVEIKDLKRGIMTLTYDREIINNIRNKNIKLNQTISDQEVTIKALLITIKEMCKEDETNA